MSVAPIGCHIGHEPEPSDSDLARLVEATRSLPQETRRVFELYKVYGWKQRRIAMHLNLTSNEVERHLRRAVLKCARALF